MARNSRQGMAKLWVKPISPSTWPALKQPDAGRGIADADHQEDRQDDIDQRLDMLDPSGRAGSVGASGGSILGQRKVDGIRRESTGSSRHGRG